MTSNFLRRGCDFVVENMFIMFAIFGIRIILLLLFITPSLTIVNLDQG